MARRPFFRAARFVEPPVPRGFKHGRTLEDLAARLDVSERTVRRDLQELADADVRVELSSVAVPRRARLGRDQARPVEAIRFRPAAVRELAADLRYYEKNHAGRGIRFIAAVDVTLSQIAAAPQSFAVLYEPDIRSAKVKRAGGR